MEPVLANGLQGRGRTGRAGSADRHALPGHRDARHAARSREIAELAVRFAGRGVVISTSSPARAIRRRRHLTYLEYMRANNARFTIHAGGEAWPDCRRSTRRSPTAGATGSTTASASSTTSRCHRASPRRRRHRCGARGHCGDGARQTDSAGVVPELHRRPARYRHWPSIRSHPCAPAFPGHRQHR